MTRVTAHREAAMSKRKLAALILALVLVLAAGIGGAYAYLTTYVTARGGFGITLADKTVLEETVSNWTKHITVSNGEGASDVFVRAKIFWADPFEIQISGAGWQKDGEGFYRYTEALPAGETTGVLDVKILNVPEDAEAGDDFNVIVVYESVLAVFNADGTPDLDTAWAGSVTVIEQ